jgi:hypothetical protein
MSRLPLVGETIDVCGTGFEGPVSFRGGFRVESLICEESKGVLMEPQVLRGNSP